MDTKPPDMFELTHCVSAQHLQEGCRPDYCSACTCDSCEGERDEILIKINELYPHGGQDLE